MSRDSSPLKDRLIFVVGARRSGTNWLQRIVGAHPAVVNVPSETYLFSMGFPPLVERFHHGLIGSGQTGFVYMDREAMLDGLRDFADSVFIGLREGLDPAAERIVERTPDHVRHLDLIGDVYPDGRFLHIVRDGRDVARSLRSQPWGPSSIAEAAEEWRSAIEAAQAAGPRLEHYLELRYEELLANPRAGIEGVFGWLGLAADEQTIEQTLAEAGVRFNVDPQAPAVAAGKWRKEFSPDDLASFERVAAPALVALGYEPVAGGRTLAATPATSPVRTQPETRPETASWAQQARKRGRSVLRVLRRRRRGLQRELRARQRGLQIVVDRFLAAVNGRDWEAVQALLTDSAHIRIVESGRPWQGRGSDAGRRLVEVLDGDPALRGRQVSGDVHPGLPTYTVVAAYRLDDGAVLDRVWTLTVEGDQISRVTYYGLPTGAGSRAEPVAT